MKASRYAVKNLRIRCGLLRAALSLGVAALALFWGAAAPPAALAQDTAVGYAVVTVTSKSKNANPIVNVPVQNIKVELDRKPQEVVGWQPYRGKNSALQLVVLMDEASRTIVSLQLVELKRFLLSLPPNVQVAVGYMMNGEPNLLQNLTTDHQAVANSLRLPMGINSINGSPYFCISALAKAWPGRNPGVRREVLMVTDGLDPYEPRTFDPNDPYVLAAISDAQNAGIVIYSIYFRGVGGFSSRTWGVDVGQNYLTELSGATGGMVYTEGLIDPVSFQPFLKDLLIKLQNQYELKFVTTPRKGLQYFKVQSTLRNIKLDAPSDVPVILASPGQ